MAGWMEFVLLGLLIEAFFEPLQSVIRTLGEVIGGD